MPNTKPVGVAFSDPELTSGTTITGAVIDSTSKILSNIANGSTASQQGATIATTGNTTKATGGTALTANAARTLTLNGTAANLVVAAGDRLRIRAAATGTLANTVTFPVYRVNFTVV